MNWSDGISRNEITSFGSVFEFNVPGIWTTNSRESELIQITDIKCEFRPSQLSSADILNKVEWHGQIEPPHQCPKKEWSLQVKACLQGLAKEDLKEKVKFNSLENIATDIFWNF